MKLTYGMDDLKKLILADVKRFGNVKDITIKVNNLRKSEPTLDVEIEECEELPQYVIPAEPINRQSEFSFDENNERD